MTTGQRKDIAWKEIDNELQLPGISVANKQTEAEHQVSLVIRNV